MLLPARGAPLTRSTMNVLLRSAVGELSAVSLGGRFYSSRNPLERRTLKELLKSVSGDGGGRGGKVSKRGGVKGFKPPETLKLGRGQRGVRWPGLSYPLPSLKSIDRVSSQESALSMKEAAQEGVDEGDEDVGVVSLRKFDNREWEPKRVSDMNWSRKGWSGRGWRGRSVGCPELPDGTPMMDFGSVVMEMKRTASHTSAGKKRTISCLVVVGNGKGAVGFAVGKAEEVRPAIRKAKNRAVNYLQVIPVCNGHTIYHNIQTKYCRTNIFMERRVKGHGLRCQRAVKAIAELAGIKDMRAKIVGSNNPLNIVRAAVKGLLSQETYQSLADKSGKFVVEFREENGMRPLVVGIPDKKRNVAVPWLKELQLLHPQADHTSLK